MPVALGVGKRDAERREPLRLAPLQAALRRFRLPVEPETRIVGAARLPR